MAVFHKPKKDARGALGALNVDGVIGELERMNEQRSGAMNTLGMENFDATALSFENLDQSQSENLNDLFNDFEKLGHDFGLESFDSAGRAVASPFDQSNLERIHSNQIAAATLISAGTAGNAGVQGYRRGLLRVSQESTTNDPNVYSPRVQFDGPAGSVPVISSLENYNEKPSRDFRVISVAYNLAAARQDAFGETIYPTVVVNPTEGGVTQNLTYAAVMQDVYHETTGAVFDTKEVNMVEAYRDPSILDDSSTKLIPVVDEQDRNKNVFVSPDLISGDRIEMKRGGAVTTAPLRIGARFDLMGVSNQAQLVAANVLDISDTIDPAIRLERIFIQLGDGKIVSFRVNRLPTATFQPSLIGDTRTAVLNFNTEDLVLRNDAQTIDQSTSAPISELSNRGWNVRLGLAVTGNVSLSKGNTQINATDVVVERLVNDNGDNIAFDEGDGKSVVDALGEMKVVAYELDARFTNTNRRERGQLVQTRTVQFRYPIPMQAPITLPMSTLDENGPGDVVKTLTVGTNIRNSNNAVIRLLNYLSQLREVVVSGYDRPKFGSVEGALSIMMRPTYDYTRIDLRDSVDTLRSKDRFEDIASTLLNAIRAKLYPAIRSSNIEAAFQTVTGNADERPKFIIATDKEIANYLMVTGDDRTLGPNMKYEIVSTNNIAFDGKIVVIPTRQNPSENDILNFGQFYYVPTIVADLPIARHGQISREIAAIPYNLHVNNIPFALEFDVLGLDEVMSLSSNQRLHGFKHPDESEGNTSVAKDNDTIPTPTA